LYFASLNEIDRGELSNHEQNGGEIESAAIMIDADHAHRAVKTKARIAEVHAISMKRLSKVAAADDPTDGADDE
jgi:hypothetical protein